jgi:putative GTP pyrophosphokinase
LARASACTQGALEMNDEDIETFLNSSLAKYERLTKIASALIENILRQEGVEFLSVTSRTKTSNTIIEKIQRKGYDDISAQMTDLSGIRIITFLDSQVRRIADIVSHAFEIDRDNSLDRSQILGSDRVGYRSVHFICALGASRKGIIEYKDISDLKFEIQIRTVLQHAWAELTHDRSYKFGGSLQIADGAFDEIAGSIDKYRDQIKNETEKNLSEEPINSISLNALFGKVTKKTGIAFDSEIRDDRQVISELLKFDIQKIGDIERLITEDIILNEKESTSVSSRLGFLRRIMMYNDLEKYLKMRPGFSAITPVSYKLLSKKYGAENLDKMLEKYSLRQSRARRITATRGKK